MKLDILGTVYDYQETTEKEDTRLCEADGYCDSYAKKIVVKNEYIENAPDSIQDFDELKRNVKRHECIHSFMFESGNREWAEDEKLIDWIAWQFPKMLKVFNEIEAI